MITHVFSKALSAVYRTDAELDLFHCVECLTYFSSSHKGQTREKLQHFFDQVFLMLH